MEYVAEKLRRSLESLHGLGTAESEGRQSQNAYAAFHYALVAYLALNNMLGAANSPTFAERLALLSRSEFRRWLDAIDRGGSVTGLVF